MHCILVKVINSRSRILSMWYILLKSCLCCCSFASPQFSADETRGSGICYPSIFFLFSFSDKLISSSFNHRWSTDVLVIQLSRKWHTVVYTNWKVRLVNQPCSFLLSMKQLNSPKKTPLKCVCERVLSTIALTCGGRGRGGGGILRRWSNDLWDSPSPPPLTYFFPKRLLGFHFQIYIEVDSINGHR